MTLEELKRDVPKHSKNLITQNLVDVFNKLEEDEGHDFAEQYKQNFISMSSILKSGNYSVTDYTNAIKFVSYKLMENSDIDAYHMTFPDRVNRIMTKWREKGLDDETIRFKKLSPYVSAYKRNDIVMKVMEQALVPSKILNAPLFQQALNVQADLMLNANSEMVRMSAANSILQYTAPNETTKIELDVGVKGNDEVQALRDEMQRLAAQQQIAITSGSKTSAEIAESTLIIEVDDE